MTSCLKLWYHYSSQIERFYNYHYKLDTNRLKTQFLIDWILNIIGNIYQARISLLTMYALMVRFTSYVVFIAIYSTHIKIGAHVTDHSLLIFQLHCKTHPPVEYLNMGSTQGLAHLTATQLSCHIQHFVMITQFKFESNVKRSALHT